MAKKTTSDTRTSRKKKKTTGAPLHYEIKLTLLIATTIFMLLAIFSDTTSFVGEWLASLLKGLFSYYAYLFPLIFLTVCFSVINIHMKPYRRRIVWSCLLLSLIFILLIGLMTRQTHHANYGAEGGLVYAYRSGQQLLSAGLIGQTLFDALNAAIGLTGIIIVVATLAMLFLTIAFGITPTSIGKRLGKSAAKTVDTLDKTNQAVSEAIKSSVTQLRAEHAAKQSDKKHLIQLLNAEQFETGHQREDDDYINTEQRHAQIKDTQLLDDAGTASLASITILDYNDQQDQLTDAEREQSEAPAIEREEYALPEQSEEAVAPPAQSEDVFTPPAESEAERSGNQKAAQDAAQVDDAATLQDIESAIAISYENYQLPSTQLLNFGDHTSSEQDKREILEKAQLLEDTLKSFKIDARVNQISKGPMITRFEIQPSPGVKVSKISGLSDDIALSLAATTVRIVAPIPGKAAVGIEIPNKTTSLVTLRDVLENDIYRQAQSLIRFALGKDISGQPIVADLAKMPHLLIAGATGSGKSVCVNTIISSILFNAKPDEVKFLMIDPKVVELNVYNDIPHLILPVVTDPKKASIALNWAVQEMNERYNSFAAHAVRDIASYNEKIARESGESMPRIVVIIDELADLMMAAPNQVEEAICRIAQMARAAGIHLIVATQRPSVDVITGVIKANIPSRIAFAVSSAVDSRTIIDMNGAEKLLGKGDMLYYPVGKAKPIRVQGAFISESEVDALVRNVKAQVDGEVHYDEATLDDIASTLQAINTSEEEVDELLSEAISFIINNEKASTSLLQRQFRIGYNRAARMIDEIEQRGIIGPSRGSKPREVLVNREEYEMTGE